jgi:MFS family permease
MLNVSRRERLLYLGWFPFGHCAVDWTGSALFILAPAIAISLDLSPAQIGLLFTAKAVGEGIVYLPAGLLGERLRRRGVFLLGTLWWVVVGFLAASIADGYWLLILLIAVASAGSAAWHPVAMGTLVQRIPERRALVLASHLVGGIVGGVLAPLSAGFLLERGMEWRAVLQLSVLPAVVGGLLYLKIAWSINIPPTDSASRFPLAHILRAWARPEGVSAVLVMIFCGIGSLALYSMLPLYLEKERGFSPGLAGVAFACVLLLGAILSPILGHVSDRIGRKLLSASALIVSGIFLSLIAVAPTTVTVWLTMLAGGMLLVAVRVVIVAMVLDVSGRRETAVIGLILVVMDGFGALGAALSGLVGNVDLSLSIALAAGFTVLAGATALFRPRVSPVSS